MVRLSRGGLSPRKQAVILQKKYAMQVRKVHKPVKKSIIRSPQKSKKSKPSPKKRGTFLPTPMQDGRNLLLDLPAELRNEIYEMVAADSGAILRRNGKLASRSALPRVSRQVHAEYQDVLKAAASPLTTYVKDFDFTHVVRFFNTLSTRELHTLPTLNDTSPRRQIKIVLQISEDCPENPEKLGSWLLRCENPSKKGTNLNIVYEPELLDGPAIFGYPGEWSSGMVRQWVSGAARAYQRARKVRDRLGKMSAKVEAGSRLHQELDKVRGALVTICWTQMAYAL